MLAEGSLQQRSFKAAAALARAKAPAAAEDV
jgi:hypothetical protein